ncbi:hypothetical protein NL108_015578, partial [Boleophthalmus pectinirostris]
LEQQDGHLTQVEVNKMLGLVGYIAAEVPPDNAVPICHFGFSICPYISAFVRMRYLLDKSSDILLNVVFLQGLGGTLHSVLLHVLRHVGIFDHSLSL